MKRIKLLLVSLTVSCASFAQSATESNGHEYVDLGLPSGTKWATCNVGASKASDYGEYYAWGAITPETKSPLDGKPMKDIQGNPKYDVATAKWGAPWNMPTEAQAKELNEKCKWSWTKLDGVKGYKVTGPNGNHIFLPAAGVFFIGSIYGDFNLWGETHFGYFYTSTPTGGSDGNAPVVQIYTGESYDDMDDIWTRPMHRVGESMENRNCGYSIRPVINNE